MIAHTPTLFAAVALVATILAFCLLLVGPSNRRNDVWLTGCGLLAHALAYVCYTVYGHAPLWLSYGVGNSLLSLAWRSIRRACSACANRPCRGG